MAAGFSFIHAADLHLDSPFRGFTTLEHVDEATRDNILRQLRECTFTALDNIVQACLTRQVDFLVLAGDIYDLADRSLRAQLRLQKALQRLAEAQIPVFVAHGNHDHQSGQQAALDWPANVHFFPPGRVQAYPVLRRGSEITRVYGISYPRREVTENYAALFRRDHDAPFAVAVLHCNVGGGTEHADYAPCTLDDLAKSGFDYWALGHVHRRSVLRERGPCVVYPGVPQGRHPREAGAGGCCLVQVSPGGEIGLQFLETDPVRWEQLQVPVEDITTEQQLLEQITARLDELRRQHTGRSLVVRLELAGRSPLHRRLELPGTAQGLLEELRLRYALSAGLFLWPESLRVVTTAPMDKASLEGSATLAGDLLAIAGEAGCPGELRERLQQALAPLHEKAGRQLSPPGEAEFDALLAEARDTALDLLLGEDDDR